MKETHLISCRSMLALLLVLLSGCQSVGGYEPLCQSDDDCASHQRCDAYLGACIRQESYPSCEPTQRFDRCPVATQCDAEARACLPRPFRVAWIYRFDSAELRDRQIANMIRFISRFVLERFSSSTFCAPSLDLPCTSPDQIELMFVSIPLDDAPMADLIRSAYLDHPFDLALPFISDAYEAARAINDEHQLDYMVFGRINRRNDVITRELEPGFIPPPLDQRFDISIVPLQHSEMHISSQIMKDQLQCERPLFIYRDRNTYAISAQILEMVWPTYGITGQTFPIANVPQASYPELITHLLTHQNDCIDFYVPTLELETLFNDYLKSTISPKTLRWLVEDYILSPDDPSLARLRQLAYSEPLREHVFVTRTALDSASSKDYIEQELLPEYTRFLDATACLAPPLPCEQLDCADNTLKEACAALNCEIEPASVRVSPSCQELSCLSSAPPAWCEAIGCGELAEGCEQISPRTLAQYDIDSLIVSDMMLLVTLLHDTLQRQPQPISRARLQQLLLDMLRSSSTHRACGYPDLETCRRAIANGEPIHYTGLVSSMEIGPDARMQRMNLDTLLHSLTPEGGTALITTYSEQDLPPPMPPQDTP